MARAFAERKRDALPDNLPPDLDTGPGMGPGPDEGAPTPRGRGTPPPLPAPTRSPFDLPPSQDQPGGGAPPRDTRANPRTVPPMSSRMEPPQITPDAKGNTTGGPAPLLALPAPVEAAPTPIPVETIADPVGQNGSVPMPLGTPGASLGPLPTLPDPVAGDGGGAGGSRTVMNPSPLPPQTMEAPAPTMTGFPVQAPQRRGPISSLFNGMTSWLRR